VLSLKQSGRGGSADSQYVARVQTMLAQHDPRETAGGGAFLGIAAQFVLAIVVILYVLLWMSLELLDTVSDVAEFDLPMRV
jgi:hypothetical protein